MSTVPDPVDDTSESIWSLHIPRRLIILPSTGLLLGLFIGMSRGGSRARLRFLAENAHRQPTTVQGWYFYTKTRNYRILFGALKQGSRDGLAIGAATSFYVLAEQGISYIRGNLTDSTRIPSMSPAIPASTNVNVQPPSPLTNLQYLDKSLSGVLLGSAVGLYGKFPPSQLARTALLGGVFGLLEGGLVMLQEEIGRFRGEEQEKVVDVEVKGDGKIEASSI